ncbi:MULTISPECIES: LysR family transcriptional regulator [Sporomusa]|uniref:LysR family transcriptional regulator n=1 Tax=Sporomusa TaxID=2375 RepID=UPI001662CF8F|nr:MULTISPECIES: LysR family transcriptional regulator [Sporomusa]HML33145.1 LysR family transcriptional regulator [Sporomusa sphaeroides]
MTIQQLRTFCAVVEDKSFHRAADRLYMAQASVSQQIAALEKYYAVLLFIRSGRSFSITAEGLSLYKWAKEILALIDAIPDKFKELHRQSEGKLVLGASTLAGNFILPPILKQFKETYPKVELSVHIGYGNEMVERVRNGTLDLAIVGKNLNWVNEAEVKFLPVAIDHLSLIAAQGHPLTKRKIVYPQELVGPYTFIHSRPGSAMRSMVEDYLKQENVTPNSILEMGNHETIKRAVEQGLGIALISTVCISREIASGQLVNIPLLNLSKVSRQFILVSKQRQEYNNVERSFIDILAGLIPPDIKA